MEILKYLAKAAAVVIAGLLCWRGKDGWGWFLFVAVIV